MMLIILFVVAFVIVVVVIDVVCLLMTMVSRIRPIARPCGRQSCSSSLLTSIFCPVLERLKVEIDPLQGKNPLRIKRTIHSLNIIVFPMPANCLHPVVQRGIHIVTLCSQIIYVVAIAILLLNGQELRNTLIERGSILLLAPDRFTTIRLVVEVPVKTEVVQLLDASLVQTTLLPFLEFSSLITLPLGPLFKCQQEKI